MGQAPGFPAPTSDPAVPAHADLIEVPSELVTPEALLTPHVGDPVENAHPVWDSAALSPEQGQWQDPASFQGAAWPVFPSADARPAPQTTATVVPTFDSLNGVLGSWNVRSTLPAVGWGLLPPVVVGLALGFWLITQGVGASSLPGSVGIMTGLTFGGSVAFGDSGLLTFTMLASSLTLLSVLGMFAGLRTSLRGDQPATSVESLQRVMPPVVLLAVSAALLNLLANTMTGDAIAYAEPSSTFWRTLFGALMWGAAAAALAILAVPARESRRTVVLREYLDAPAAGLAIVVIASGVVVLILSAVSLLVQGGELGEVIAGLLFLMIQLPTLALALLGAAVFAPFDVSFDGLVVSGTIVDAAGENPWFWLVPVGFLVVGTLGAAWMLLRRADASRAKADLAVFAGLAVAVGLLGAVIVSVNLQVLGQGLSLKLSAAIVLILPLAALVWWVVAVLLLSRRATATGPGGAVASVPWTRPAPTPRAAAASAGAYRGVPGTDAVANAGAAPALVDSKPLVEQGLYAYVQATGDVSGMPTMVHQYDEVSSYFDSALTPRDTCLFAFAGMIIRPDIRTSCFVAVLQDRVAIAWRQGALKKTIVGLQIPFMEIADVSWGPGATPETARAQVARIMAVRGEVTVALPLGNADAVGEIVRNAILGHG